MPATMGLPTDCRLHKE